MNELQDIEQQNTLVIPASVPDPFNRRVFYQTRSGTVVVQPYAGLPSWVFDEDLRDYRLFGERERDLFSAQHNGLISPVETAKIPSYALTTQQTPVPAMEDTAKIEVQTPAIRPIPAQPQKRRHSVLLAVLLILIGLLLFVAGGALAYLVLGR